MQPAQTPLSQLHLLAQGLVLRWHTNWQSGREGMEGYRGAARVHTSPRVAEQIQSMKD